ncbi:MAG: hypothetical protein GW823_05065 [Bacteroidetes bacterium]|nr:hypothetical protein [Bacteroidota bacterium]
MEKKHLLESAANINQVRESTYVEFQEKAELLSQKMNTIMLKRPDLEKLIGENNLTMMKDNHANHVRFIASMLKNHNAEVLLDTVLWVFRAYRSHGFATNYWAAQLNAWFTILKENLNPESYAEVLPYYEWMQVNIPAFVLLSDEKLEAPFSRH